MDVYANIVLLVALAGLVLLLVWFGGQNLKLHADLSSLYDSLKSKTDPLWQYQGIHKDFFSVNLAEVKTRETFPNEHN